MTSLHLINRCDRLSIPEALTRLDTWPTVDVSALSSERRDTFQKRCHAITVYITEPKHSVSSITSETGVDRKTLRRLVDRCTTVHPDGRLYGFRGALPGLHVKAYERFAPVSFTRTGGRAGAFKQLLQRYPDIASYLRRMFVTHNREVQIEREVRKSMRSIHQQFLKMCRASGVHADEYPFTERRLGIRSLYTHFKSLAEESFEMSVKHAGGQSVRAAPTSTAQVPAATRAYEVVEFDGHKIDLRLTVRLSSPGGEQRLVEIHRIWLLVVLDVATRCVLGHHVALSVEYSKADVACALQAALCPFRAHTYRIPTLAVREGGGFPSQRIPELEYACWDWFRCDNAKAHLAPDTIERLTQTIGCWTDVGAPAQPNDRPHIERFFHLISRHFAHQLPGNLGSNPSAIERALSDPKGDLRLLVDVDELEDMIEVLLADYNGEPHTGLYGRTPLEAMAHSVAQHGSRIRTLPIAARPNLCLLHEAKIVIIKGKPGTGLRPYINFISVRYTSPLLASSPALIGKKLRIYYDPRDIRVVKAFFDDGTELGILSAARPWCFTPHSLRVRREVCRLIAERKLAIREGDNPIEAWARMRSEQRHNKGSAGLMAKQQRLEQTSAANDDGEVDQPYIAPAPAAPAHAPHGGDPVSDVPSSTDNDEVTIVPKTLTIRKTLTF